RPGRHAARADRSPAAGDRPRAAAEGNPGRRARARHARRRREAGRVRRVRALRSREVGQGHQGRGHQGSVGGSMRGFFFTVAIALATVSHGQTWPGKPVRVIVNVAAGGVADVTARVLSARLGEALGQSFLVENRAGGDGYIGFDAVARSDPDGHTLLYSPGSSMMIAPHIVNRPDLDPLKVLAPVAATGRVSLYVITHPERPYKNFGEFLSHARANPGKLNYGTPGNGTSPHIATEVFNR